MYRYIVGSVSGGGITQNYFTTRHFFDYLVARGGYTNPARRVISNTWMVKVELALERLGFLLRCEDPIEAVLTKDGHLPLVVVDLVLPKQLHDLTAHRRLVVKKHNRN